MSDCPDAWDGLRARDAEVAGLRPARQTDVPSKLREKREVGGAATGTAGGGGR